jgi:hypothetical protein
LQQRLSLLQALCWVTTTIKQHLLAMTLERTPALDLAFVVITPTTHVIAALHFCCRFFCIPFKTYCPLSVKVLHLKHTELEDDVQKLILTVKEKI